MAKKEAGIDEDTELFAFFSGGYAGELGLRSNTGQALDRASFQLGPSQGYVGDGWNKNVRFGVMGPGGRIEAGRVMRALSVLTQPFQQPKAKPGEKPRPPVPVPAYWDDYLPVLRGYYTRRPQAYYGPVLTAALGELVGASIATPLAGALAASWCAEHLAADLVANAEAVVASRAAAATRLGILRGQLRTVLASSDRARFLRAHHLRRQIAAAEAPLREPDTEKTTRERWSTPTEDHAAEALRRLVHASSGPKDTPDRKEAKDALAVILDQARTIRWAAREAYSAERRRQDAEIRERPAKLDKAELDALAASLEYFPADQD